METFLLVVAGVVAGLLVVFTVYAAIVGLLGVLTGIRPGLPTLHVHHHHGLGFHHH